MWAVHPEAEARPSAPEPDHAVDQSFVRAMPRRDPKSPISQTDLPAVVVRPKKHSASKPGDAGTGGPRRYTAVQMEAVNAPLRPRAAPETKRATPTSKKEESPGITAQTRMLDDHDFFDNVDETIVLELDALPAGHVGFNETIAGPQSQMVRFTPQPMEAVESSPSREMAAATNGEKRTSSREMPSPALAVQNRLPSTTTMAAVSSTAIAGGDPRRPGIFAFAGFGIAPERLSEMPSYALRVMARRRVLRRDLAIAKARRAQDVELYESALRMVDEAALQKGMFLLIAMICAVFLAIGMAFALVA